MLGQFGVRQKHAAGAEKRASGLAWRHALLRHRLFYRHVHLYRLSRLSPSTLVRIVSLVVSLEGLSRRLTLVRIVSLTCTRRCTRGWYAGATAATVQQCPLYISLYASLCMCICRAEREAGVLGQQLARPDGCASCFAVCVETGRRLVGGGRGRGEVSDGSFVWQVCT